MMVSYLSVDNNLHIKPWTQVELKVLLYARQNVAATFFVIHLHNYK